MTIGPWYHNIFFGMVFIIAWISYVKTAIIYYYYIIFSWGAFLYTSIVSKMFSDFNELAGSITPGVVTEIIHYHLLG